MFKESISSEELQELPLKHFEGEIILVDNSRKVRQAAQYLSQCNIIGFDTETKPAFRKGEKNKVALLQLASHDCAFLFQLQKTGLPFEIRKIFSNPQIIKPGVAIRDDLKALQKIDNFVPAGFVELQEFAHKAGIQNISLKKLTAIICGFRISKSQQLSNWELEELSAQQMQYAATDAWASLIIYEGFMKNNHT